MKMGFQICSIFVMRSHRNSDVSARSSSALNVLVLRHRQSQTLMGACGRLFEALVGLRVKASSLQAASPAEASAFFSLLLRNLKMFPHPDLRASLWVWSRTAVPPEGLDLYWIDLWIPELPAWINRSSDLHVIQQLASRSLKKRLWNAERSRKQKTFYVFWFRSFTSVHTDPGSRSGFRSEKLQSCFLFG